MASLIFRSCVLRQAFKALEATSTVLSPAPHFYKERYLSSASGKSLAALIRVFSPSTMSTPTRTTESSLTDLQRRQISTLFDQFVAVMERSRTALQSDIDHVENSSDPFVPKFSMRTLMEHYTTFWLALRGICGGESPVYREVETALRPLDVPHNAPDLVTVLFDLMSLLHVTASAVLRPVVAPSGYASPPPSSSSRDFSMDVSPLNQSPEQKQATAVKLIAALTPVKDIDDVIKALKVEKEKYRRSSMGPTSDCAQGPTKRRKDDAAGDGGNSGLTC